MSAPFIHLIVCWDVTGLQYTEAFDSEMEASKFISGLHTDPTVHGYMYYRVISRWNRPEIEVKSSSPEQSSFASL